MPSSLANGVKPDYTMTTMEVYTVFAKAEILKRNKLPLLEECTCPSSLGNPSRTHQVYI